MSPARITQLSLFNAGVLPEKPAGLLRIGVPAAGDKKSTAYMAIAYGKGGRLGWR
jgi:hypothetical protein